jgi:hypothetical protein
MRINKSLILVTTFATAAVMAGVPSSATAASTAADVPGTVLKIVEVGTDAMGVDTYANRNREFVKFQNVSGGSIDVANVLVEDNWAHAKTVAGDSHSCNTYKVTNLPDNATTTIANGEFVTVFNGRRWGGDRKVNGNEYQLFANSDPDCGTAGQFYNNDADTAWVSKANGDVYSSKSWDWNGGYTVKP